LQKKKWVLERKQEQKERLRAIDEERINGRKGQRRREDTYIYSIYMYMYMYSVHASQQNTINIPLALVTTFCCCPHNNSTYMYMYMYIVTGHTQYDGYSQQPFHMYMQYTQFCLNIGRGHLESKQSHLPPSSSGILP